MRQRRLTAADKVSEATCILQNLDFICLFVLLPSGVALLYDNERAFGSVLMSRRSLKVATRSFLTRTLKPKARNNKVQTLYGVAKYGWGVASVLTDERRLGYPISST